MEIEAKYTAPDEQFAGLLEVKALGEYSLETLEEQDLIDHYIDTSDCDIWQSGYTCRTREKNGQWLVAVKGLGGAEGAIHQREEYEMKIQPGTLPQQWPHDPVCDLVMSLACSQPLVELFVIRQRRITRMVHRGGLCIGAMSLDTVDMESVGERGRIYEVEIELKQDGVLEDLRVLDEILQAYDLRPEPHSKFERAMARLEELRRMKGEIV